MKRQSILHMNVSHFIHSLLPYRPAVLPFSKLLNEDELKLHEHGVQMKTDSKSATKVFFSITTDLLTGWELLLLLALFVVVFSLCTTYGWCVLLETVRLYPYLCVCASANRFGAASVSSHHMYEYNQSNEKRKWISFHRLQSKNTTCTRVLVYTPY